MNTATKILVVDDVREMRALLRSLLTSFGYVVCEASSAVEAIPMVRSDESIRLMLLDIGLEGQDGFAILEKVKPLIESRGLRVCFVSGRSQREDILKSIAMGSSDYIVKPIDPMVLKAKVQALLTNTSQIAQFVSVKVNLEAFLVTGVVDIPLTVTELSEESAVLSMSLQPQENASVQIAIPIFDVPGSDRTIFTAKLASFKKAKAGVIEAKVNFVGLTEGLAARVRAFVLKSRQAS